MEPQPPGRTRCDACVWWVEATDGRDGDCPYRAAAASSNAAWKQIATGRCSHFLADPRPPVEAVADERDAT